MSAALGLSFALTGSHGSASAAGPPSLADRLSASTRALLEPNRPPSGIAQPARPPVTRAVSPAVSRSIVTQPKFSNGRIDYSLIDYRLNLLAAQPDMVGFSVAIVENGQVQFLRGYGVTSTATGEAVKTDTVFRWASLSKGVAATVVAELAEDGKLSLNDPVSRWAPSLRLPGGAETRITVADLLAHRVGLPHNALDNKLEAGVSPVALRGMLGSLATTCAPATCHDYQNVAFDAAAEIVERVTGRPYQEVARDRLFRPLGMRSASMTRSELFASSSWARPHVGRVPVQVTEPYYRVAAAGGVNSSIADLARWMVAQMGETPGTISDGVLREIHRPRVATNRNNGTFNRAMTDQNYALGWRRYTYAGHAMIGHQGAVRGYRSTILFDPVRKAGVAVMWNSGSGKPFAFPLEIADMLYRQPQRDWMKLNTLPTVTRAAAAGLP